MFQVLREQFEQATSRVQSSQILGSQLFEKKIKKMRDSKSSDSNFMTPIYQKYLKQKLINTLNIFQGKKVLVTDQYIADLLSLVLEQKKTLKENGIEEIFYIDNDVFSLIQSLQQGFRSGIKLDYIFCKAFKKLYETNCQNYTTQSNVVLSKIVFIDLFTKIQCSMQRVPGKGSSIKQLNTIQVMGNLMMKNFNFDLISLESKLLSLELNDNIKELYLNKEQTSLHLIAESIQRMQLIHGNFTNIYAKGENAKNVIEILRQNEVSGIHLEEEDAFKNSKMESLIILDRTCDVITPMCTPFTYEALIDEFFNIKHNQIILEASNMKKGALSADKQKIMKLSKIYDPIFEPVRDFNIKRVIRELEDKRSQNKLIMQQKNETKSMEEMQVFLERVKQVQKEHNFVLDHYIVTSHIESELDSILFNLNMTQEAHTLLQIKQNLLEQHLENLVAIKAPLEKVMRLLILYCQVNNGIKKKIYDFFRREIIHTYGLEHIITFSNCEKLKLLGSKLNDSNVWEKIQQPLNLINENVDHDNPQDFSYVFLAYAPITCRLVEQVLQSGGWKNIMKTIKDIPGDTIIQENLQTLKQEDQKPNENGSIVVYFIGGVTYGEIACLRWLADFYDRDIVICTTHITSGNKLVRDMVRESAVDEEEEDK